MKYERKKMAVDNLDRISLIVEYFWMKNILALVSDTYTQ